MNVQPREEPGPAGFVDRAAFDADTRVAVNNRQLCSLALGALAVGKLISRESRSEIAIEDQFNSFERALPCSARVLPRDGVADRSNEKTNGIRPSRPAEPEPELALNCLDPGARIEQAFQNVVSIGKLDRQLGIAAHFIRIGCRGYRSPGLHARICRESAAGRSERVGRVILRPG